MVDYLLTANGSVTGLQGPDDLPLAEHLRLMDGVDLFALQLWAMPAGKTIDTIRPATDGGDAYLQCAGTADAMTVELQTAAGEHLVLGIRPEQRGSRRIWWDDATYSVEVAPHEVFTAESAAAVFDDYFHHGDVTLPVTRRSLDVS